MDENNNVNILTPGNVLVAGCVLFSAYSLGKLAKDWTVEIMNRRFEKAHK